MRFPLSMNIKLGAYLMGRKWRKVPRFPIVLMLEPTHLCNLRCEGCGRIREYQQSREHSLDLEQCLQAAEETQAPVVSICGGEPLLYPQIDELITALAERKHIIYLCTNALRLEKHLDHWQPRTLFYINVHLDGMAATHDAIVGKPGVFEHAVAMIRRAKQQGFQVCTNTTVYQQTSVSELDELFGLLTSLKVDGILVAPGFSYEVVADTELFLSQEQIHQKFQQISAMTRRKGYRLINTPPYMRYLRGEKDLPCTPWGCPTRNPQGWKSPCYLITDQHYASFAELLAQTDWPRFENKQDPRCQHCKVHSGFEPSVSIGAGVRWWEKLEMVFWSLF